MDKQQPPPLLVDRRLDDDYYGGPDEKLLGMTKKSLAKLLAEDPNDEKVRTFLLEQCYRNCIRNRKASTEPLFEHLVWFFENKPDASCLENCNLIPDRGWDFVPHLKEICSDAMKRAESTGESNLLIEHVVAHMFFLVDRDWSIELLEKCYALEPECEDWPRELVQFCEFSDRSETNLDGISFAFDAIALHKKYPRYSYLEQYFTMEIARWFSWAMELDRLDACRAFANALLDRQHTHPDKWRRTEGLLFSDCLGQIALKENNLDACEKHLFETLEYFGNYHMFEVELVKKLLNAKCNSLVQKYLEALDARFVDLQSDERNKMDLAEMREAHETLHELLAKLKALKPGSRKKISGHLQLGLRDRTIFSLEYQ